jgi:hypothetical protein
MSMVAGGPRRATSDARVVLHTSLAFALTNHLASSRPLTFAITATAPKLTQEVRSDNIDTY